MADEKPKAPTGADIMAAIESHRAESRANDAAILKALESIMAKQAEQDATMAAIRNTVNQPVQAGVGAPADTGPPPDPSTWPAVFPNYGRSKGQPIAGASSGDLDYYANGARRSIADPAKARFRDKERALLAAIEAEIARQKGGGAPPDEVPAGLGGGRWDDPPPPPEDEPLF